LARGRATPARAGNRPEGMAYNHQVWRDVRKRLLAGPRATSPKKLLSGSALVERRRPYYWVWFPEEEALAALSSTVDSAASPPESPGASRPHSAASRAQSLVYSLPEADSPALSRSASTGEISVPSELGFSVAASRTPSLAFPRRPSSQVSLGSRASFRKGSKGSKVSVGRWSQGGEQRRKDSKVSVLSQEDLHFFDQDCTSPQHRNSRGSKTPGRASETGTPKSTSPTSARKPPTLPGHGSQAGTPKSGRSSQLIRSGASVLQEAPPELPEEPVESPRVEKDPPDPEEMRALARRHQMVFQEVMKYRAIFDDLDYKAKDVISRQQFEKLIYGCTMSPKRARLPKARLLELWKAADVGERDEIDFEEFIAFYRKHADDMIGGLRY